MTLATLYTVGFLITALVTVFEDRAARQHGFPKIPPVMIFVLCLVWPLIWTLNIAAWIYARHANRR